MNRQKVQEDQQKNWICSYSTRRKKKSKYSTHIFEVRLSCHGPSRVPRSHNGPRSVCQFQETGNSFSRGGRGLPERNRVSHRSHQATGQFTGGGSTAGKLPFPFPPCSRRRLTRQTCRGTRDEIDIRAATCVEMMRHGERPALDWTRRCSSPKSRGCSTTCSLLVLQQIGGGLQVDRSAMEWAW